MSYLENHGNRLISDAYALRDMGPNVMQLPAARMPLHPGEFAAHSANAVIPALLGAERAREYAWSYREFLVGAAAVAYFYSPHGARKMNFSHGANAKPVPGSDIINVHAEHTVMTAINAEKRPGESVYVPVLAVVGDLQPDQQSGEETLTLHPCGLCREAFDHPDTPIDRRTLIVTANPDFTVVEWLSLGALARVHSASDHEGIDRALFKQRSPILTPPNLEGRNFIRLSEFDTPEMDHYEDEYEEKVMFPVIRYVMQMMQ